MKVREMLYGQNDPYKQVVNPLPINTHGWNSDNIIFAQTVKELKPQLIVEVGTWLGASARFLVNLALQHQDDVELVCIDTWLGSEEHWINPEIPMSFEEGRPLLFKQFLSNTIRANLTKFITPFPIDSINGARILKRLGVIADLVYLDAGHEYESVVQDLKLYRDLVRVGGKMIIDDIHHPPIQRAIKDVLGCDIPENTQAGNKAVWRRDQ